MTDYAEVLWDAIEKSGNNYDKDRIAAALEFAKKAHEGQLRKSGEPYISHPISVAAILVSYDCDTSSVVAALLHDTIEDTPASAEEIKKLFGDDVVPVSYTHLIIVEFNKFYTCICSHLSTLIYFFIKSIRGPPPASLEGVTAIDAVESSFVANINPLFSVNAPKSLGTSSVIPFIV